MLSCSFVFEQSLLSVHCWCITKSTSGNDYPIDGQKCTPKTNYFFNHKPLLLVSPYDTIFHIEHNEYYLFYIDSIVLTCISQTVLMMPWMMPSWSLTISKNENCFYMIFVLDIFIYILYWVYSRATTCCLPLQQPVGPIHCKYWPTYWPIIYDWTNVGWQLRHLGRVQSKF